MLDRHSAGRVPPKPHLVFEIERGRMAYEECITRGGFEDAFSILYHRHRPHEALPADEARAFALPVAAPARHLVRRHYRCLAVSEASPLSGQGPLESRVALLFNPDVVIGFARPARPDGGYFINADADEIYFVHRGGGVLRSVFGDLRFERGDYVCVPKGTLHRFVPDEGTEQAWLTVECKGGVGLPARYRNSVGQLRMDAPYSHRDFRRPEFVGPLDEGLREITVKRGDAFFAFRTGHSPLDVVGWDGAVYPFAFAVLAFQPRVGMIHLPPPAHAMFEARGALICNFVPRPLDFHPLANPCPYPHASVDVDEVIFYANAAFGSRRGVGEGSLSHHPAGIPHGPHPGAYERFFKGVPLGERTEELAVMLDCSAPLTRTTAAAACEDATYHASFVAASTDL
jgi:homogentisate 1,2-dioxygenase